MPRYDIACSSGHLFEVFEDRERVARACPQCHYVNVGRAMEAQHELVYQAEKAHVPLPDFWKIAQDRVKRGDAVAIP